VQLTDNNGAVVVGGTRIVRGYSDEIISGVSYATEQMQDIRGVIG
jgi:hypothetical protein